MTYQLSAAARLGCFVRGRWCRRGMLCQRRWGALYSRQSEPMMLRRYNPGLGVPAAWKLAAGCQGVVQSFHVLSSAAPSRVRPNLFSGD